MKTIGIILAETIGLVLLYARFRHKVHRLWRAARHAVWTFKVLGLDAEEENTQSEIKGG